MKIVDLPLAGNGQRDSSQKCHSLSTVPALLVREVAGPPTRSAGNQAAGAEGVIKRSEGRAVRCDDSIGSSPRHVFIARAAATQA